MSDYDKYLKKVVGVLPPPLNYISEIGGLVKVISGLGKKLGGIFHFKTKLLKAPPGYAYKRFMQRTTPSKNEGRGQIISANQVLYDKNTGFPAGRWSYSRQAIMPLLGISREGAFVFAEAKGSKKHMQSRMQMITDDRLAPVRYDIGYTNERMEKTRQTAARMLINDKLPVNQVFKERTLGTGGERSRGRGGMPPSGGDVRSRRGDPPAGNISGGKIAAGLGIAAAIAKIAGIL